MSNDTVDLARNFFDALARKDFSALPLAADVVMESPITPRLSGVDSVLEFLEGLASVTRVVRVLDFIVEGNKVAVEFEIETASGRISGFECLEILDGRIKKLRPYFDSRPLLWNGVSQA
jgi:ketosteroid isomerase-like protein